MVDERKDCLSYWDGKFDVCNKLSSSTYRDQRLDINVTQPGQIHDALPNKYLTHQSG